MPARSVVPLHLLDPAADAYPFMSWLKPLAYVTAYEPGLPASLLTELGRVKETQLRRTPALDAHTMKFAPRGSWVLWEQYAKELTRDLPPERALATRRYVWDVANNCLTGCLQVKKQNPEQRSDRALGALPRTCTDADGHGRERRPLARLHGGSLPRRCRRWSSLRPLVCRAIPDRATSAVRHLSHL